MQNEETHAHARQVLAELALACAQREACSIRHVVRPALISHCLAGLLGLSAQEQEHIRLATATHDVGKLAVPHALLAKTGQLSAQEWTTIQEHALNGAHLFGQSHSPLLLLAGDIARSHHERYDGVGYPYGLSGTAIPLAARIVAVADVFDALTDTRPYHRVISEDEAEHLITQGSGTQFDPEVATVFSENYDHILAECRRADQWLSTNSHRAILDRFFGLSEQGAPRPLDALRPPARASAQAAGPRSDVPIPSGYPSSVSEREVPL